MASPNQRSVHLPISRPAPMGKVPDPSVSLHLALAWLLIRATPANDQGVILNIYSMSFVAAILDVIAQEAFEVNPAPGTYAALRATTDALIAREATTIARTNARRRARGQAVSADQEQAEAEESWLGAFSSNFEDINNGCSFIDTIEREIRNRISEDNEETLEGVEPLERRSPLGLFFRGMLVSLRRMSFDETAVLSAQVAEWCGIKLGEGSHVPTAWSLLRSAATSDPKSSPALSSVIECVDLHSPAADSSHQAAMASGDYSLALTSLMRFYDYQMPSSGRAMHQYALLNLASFHYSTGGLDSAALALRDAIRLARAQNDHVCLQECVSLMYRLNMETEAAAWPGLEVPKVQRDALPPRRLKKTASPMDEVWSIKAAVDLGEPIPVVFRRVYVALGQHHASTPPPSSEKNENPLRSGPSGQLNTPAWHAAQAGLWSLLGSDSLADTHETMALASPDLENETRMAVIYARAERAALRGQFDEALASLLDLGTVQGLVLPEYHVWARTVWAILEREARLRQDVDAQAIIDGLRPPTASAERLGPGGPLREYFDAAARAEPSTRGVVFAHGEVTDALRQARKMLDANVPPHVALPRVLSALHLASGLGLWPLYRSGTVTLGEVLLAMESPGMAAKADAEVASVWDALVVSGDDEAIARGAYVRARAHAALALGEEEDSEPDSASAVRALQYAHTATVHADAVGLRAVKRGAAALKAMLEELDGREPDTSAWAAADKDLPRLSDKVRRAGEVVRLVGVRVAEGWS